MLQREVLSSFFKGQNGVKHPSLLAVFCSLVRYRRKGSAIKTTLAALCPGQVYLTSLRLSVPICKIGCHHPPSGVLKGFKQFIYAKASSYTGLQESNGCFYRWMERESGVVEGLWPSPSHASICLIGGAGSVNHGLSCG